MGAHFFEALSVAAPIVLIYVLFLVMVLSGYFDDE